MCIRDRCVCVCVYVWSASVYEFFHTYTSMHIHFVCVIHHHGNQWRHTACLCTHNMHLQYSYSKWHAIQTKGTRLSWLAFTQPSWWCSMTNHRPSQSKHLSKVGQTHTPAKSHRGGFSSKALLNNTSGFLRRVKLLRSEVCVYQWWLDGVLKLGHLRQGCVYWVTDYSWLIG